MALISNSTDFQPTTESKFSNVKKDFDEIYDYAGSNIGYVSRYPSYDLNRDNEDYFAQQQSGTDKLANTAKTFSTLATNTFANHFVGYGRNSKALAGGDWDSLWKDAFGEESANLIQAQANLNPIYETKEQTAFNENSKGIVGAFKQFIPGVSNRAGNAWATLGGQLGFTAGTIGAVASETAGLALLTPETGGASAAALASKTPMNAVKIAKSFYNLFATGKRLSTVKNVAEGGNIIAKTLTSKPIQIARMYLAAAGEAAIEANSSAIEFKQDQIEKYKSQFGIEPTPEFLQEVEEASTKVGNTTFNWNIPVLMTSNLLTIGNLFKPGNLAIAEATQKGLKETSKYLSSKSILNGVLKNYPKALKGVEIASKGGSFLSKDKFSEGLEEVLQSAGSKAAAHQYDLFESEETTGLNNYLVGVAEQLGHSLQTREGWDEFASGYLTGFGIQAVTTGFNKVSGRSKKAKEQVAERVAELATAHEGMVAEYKEKQANTNDPFSTANNNVVTQNAVNNAVEASIEDNDIREGKDLKVDAKINTFAHLSRFGVAKEYFNVLAANIEELKESDPQAYEAMTKGRSAQEIALGLEKEYEAHQQKVNTIRKNVKNNYKVGSKEYNLREHIIQYAAGLELQATDAKQRAEGIHSKLIAESKVDELIMQALLEPSQLNDILNNLKSSLEISKEAVAVQSGTAKKITQKEVDNVTEKVALLEKLEKATSKEGVDTQETVSSVLKAFFGSSNLVSEEVKNSLTDLIELNNDNRNYTAMYNLLSNKEYFEKFGEAFVREANNRSKLRVAKAEKATFQPKSETTEQLSKEEFQEKIAEAEGLSDLLGFSQELEVAKKITVENGKIKFGNKTFDSASDLLESLLDGNKEVRKLIEKQGLKDHFVARLNKIVEESTDNEEALLENESAPIDQPGYIDNSPLKTKEQGNKEEFYFKTHSLGQTLLHYYDIVIGNIWGGDGVKHIIDTLSANKGSKAKETLVKVQDAFTTLNKKANVTMIYLANEDSIYEKEGAREAVKNSNEIEVVYDGIRFYILTSNTRNAADIIQETLGLEVKKTNGATIVRNSKGNPISSPFREGHFDEKSDNAIHSMKRGEPVKLRVANSDYNQKLRDDRNTGKITEQEYVDQLTVEVTVIDKNGDEVVVGILRATDFLFESNPSKQEEIKKYREQLSDLSLGESLGSTTYTAPAVARGKNIQGGEIIYTKLSEYSPENFNTEFFFITPKGIINEKGEVVELEELNLTRVRSGAVYMKITGKDNDKRQTVQTYGEVTEEDFLAGEFKEDLETDLSLDMPIISKRIIIDLGNIDESMSEETKSEQIEEQVVSALPVQEKTVKHKVKEEVKDTLADEKADIERRRKQELDKKVNDRFTRVQDQKNNLKENQEAPLEIGTPYTEGMKIIAEFVEGRTEENTDEGYEVITKVRRPQINTDGVMTQVGIVEVTVYDSKESAKEDITLKKEKSKERSVKKASEINAKYDAELAEVKAKHNALGVKSSEKKVAIKAPLSRLEEITARINEIGVEITEVLEGIQDMYAPTFLDKLRVLTDGIKLLVHKHGIDTKAIEKEIKALKSGLLKEVYSKKPGAVKEIIELLQESSQIKNEVTVVDNSGIEVTVNNPEVEGNTLKHDTGEIDVTDIKEVKETVEEEAVKEDTAESWEEISVKSKEEIFEWLTLNSVPNTTYSLADGTVIKVLFKDGNNLIYRSIKGEVTLDVHYSDGKFVEGKPNREKSIINALNDLLALHGITGMHLERLQKAFKASKKGGKSIQTITELLDAAEFTADEIEAVQLSLTSATEENFWEFIANSETFYTKKIEKEFESVKNSITPSVEELASIPLGESPVEAERKHVNKLWNRIKNKLPLDISLQDLAALSNDGIKKVIQALQELTITKEASVAYPLLVLKLNQLGVRVKEKGITFTTKVSKWSKGRSPKIADKINTIVEDIDMFYQGYVRNEEDGLFIKMKPIQKESSENIRKIQKLFVDLRSVKVEEDILRAYEKVNGNFKGLQERLQLEKDTSVNNNNESVFTLTEVDIKDKSKKHVTTAKIGRQVTFKGDIYRPFSFNSKGEQIYLKEGEILTVKEVNKLVKPSTNIFSKNSTLSKRVSKVKKLVEKETCS